MKNNTVKEVDLVKEVSNNNRKIYLHLVLELAPKRLHIEGCRIVLGKFVKAAWFADLVVVIAQCEDNLEVSIEKVYMHVYEHVAGEDSIPESVIQIQKYFPKDRPKRGDRLVFTNTLIVHDKEIEEIIKNVKYSLERHKIRIGV